MFLQIADHCTILTHGATYLLCFRNANGCMKYWFKKLSKSFSSSICSSGFNTYRWSCRWSFKKTKNSWCFYIKFWHLLPGRSSTVFKIVSLYNLLHNWCSNSSLKVSAMWGSIFRQLGHICSPFSQLLEPNWSVCLMFLMQYIEVGLANNWSSGVSFKVSGKSVTKIDSWEPSCPNFRRWVWKWLHTDYTLQEYVEMCQ